MCGNLITSLHVFAYNAIINESKPLIIDIIKKEESEIFRIRN
jgi:hypothetical protein